MSPKKEMKTKVSDSIKPDKNTDKEEKINDNLNDQTYVKESKVQEAIEVLRKVVENFRQEATTNKQQLFSEDTDFVFLQITLKKIPANFSTYIHYIGLPHHWRHEINYETCLIVKDVNQKPLPDRVTDLEQTREFYQNLLQENSSKGLISEILPMRQLRTEFQLPALKKKLSHEYNAFLCDKKLLRNKYSFLSSFLGKAFWIHNKKVPILLDLEQNNLKEQIEEKLNQTSLYVSGKGSTLTICIGSLKQESKKLVKNLMVVLEKIKQLYGNNVRDLAIKTERSMAILFYMDLGSANEIAISKQHNDRPQNQFVEEEFDFLTNANVRVFKDGRIRIVKRKLQENEEQNEQDSNEINFIKTINNSPDDEHWDRRLVSNVSKHLKRQKISAKKLKRVRKLN